MKESVIRRVHNAQAYKARWITWINFTVSCYTIGINDVLKDFCEFVDTKICWWHLVRLNFIQER